MTPYTDITVLVDRSGSMESIKVAMEAGFAKFVQEHRAIPSTRLTLIEFDDTTGVPVQTGHFGTLYGKGLSLETLYQARPINEVPPFVLNPRGATPLMDALCLTIDNTGTRLKAIREELRPSGVLFVIITDGEENASKTFKRKDVAERIKHQTGKYEWQFIYLGANQDALREAESYGIPQAQAMTYAASAPGTASGMGSTAYNTVQFTRSVSKGMTVAASSGSLSYSNHQRQEAVDNDVLKKLKDQQGKRP